MPGSTDRIYVQVRFCSPTLDRLVHGMCYILFLKKGYPIAVMHGNVQQERTSIGNPFFRKSSIHRVNLLGLFMSLIVLQYGCIAMRMSRDITQTNSSLRIIICIATSLQSRDSQRDFLNGVSLLEYLSRTRSIYYTSTQMPKAESGVVPMILSLEYYCKVLIDTGGDTSMTRTDGLHGVPVGL